jgi:hypothetical protein
MKTNVTSSKKYWALDNTEVAGQQFGYHFTRHDPIT